MTQAKRVSDKKIFRYWVEIFEVRTGAKRELLLNGVRRWVSLISITFEPAQTGTRVTHTEQYTFLVWADDGAHDQAHLRGSTQLSFNALAALVEEPRP